MLRSMPLLQGRPSLEAQGQGQEPGNNVGAVTSSQGSGMQAATPVDTVDGCCSDV